MRAVAWSAKRGWIRSRGSKLVILQTLLDSAGLLTQGLWQPSRCTMLFCAIPCWGPHYGVRALEALVERWTEWWWAWAIVAWHHSHSQ